MEKVGIFLGYFEYTTAIWNIFRPFGNLEAIWYLFHRFGMLCQEKSGNPDSDLKIRGRSSKFELRWVVQLLKLFYIFRKRASLGRAAL
jgi:hypothetical protein